MTIRMASLLAAMALAVATPPTFAQDAGDAPGSPPPLPELGDASWDAEWDEYLPEQPGEAPPPREDRRSSPIERPRVILGYSDAERDDWLALCRERAQGRLDICENYLARYERAAYGDAPAQGLAGCGYTAGPMNWVRVPIVRSARPR